MLPVTDPKLGLDAHPALSKEQGGRLFATLECVHARFADLAGIRAESRRIAWQVAAGASREAMVISPEHQPNFFARLVPDEWARAGLARSWLELSGIEGAASSSSSVRPALQLRPSTGAVVLLRGSLLPSGAAARVEDGAEISICCSGNVAEIALALRLRLWAEPAHEPSAPPPWPLQQDAPLAVSAQMLPHQPPASSPTASAFTARQPRLRAEPRTPWGDSLGSSPMLTSQRLPADSRADAWTARGRYHMVCAWALGADVSAWPAGAKTIDVPSDGSLCIGRSHQAGFFEGLLRSSEGKYYLHCISRSHLEVSPMPDLPGRFLVTNRSANPVVLNSAVLHRGDEGTARVGDTLSFIAAGHAGAAGEAAADPREPVVYLDLRFEGEEPQACATSPQLAASAVEALVSMAPAGEQAAGNELTSCQPHSLQRSAVQQGVKTLYCLQEAPSLPLPDCSGLHNTGIGTGDGDCNRRPLQSSAARTPCESPGTLLHLVGQPPLPSDTSTTPPRSRPPSDSGSCSGGEASWRTPPAPPPPPPFYLRLSGSAVGAELPREMRRVEGAADGLTVGRSHQRELHAAAFSARVQQLVSRDHLRIERRGAGACRLIALSQNPIWHQAGARGGGGAAGEGRVQLAAGQATPLASGDAIWLFTGADDGRSPEGPGSAGGLCWTFNEAVLGAAAERSAVAGTREEEEVSTQLLRPQCGSGSGSGRGPAAYTVPPLGLPKPMEEQPGRSSHGGAGVVRRHPSEASQDKSRECCFAKPADEEPATSRVDFAVAAPASAQPQRPKERSCGLGSFFFRGSATADTSAGARAYATPSAAG